MLHALPQQRRHMVIRQRIKHGLAVAPRLNQPRLLQHAQLVRYGGLCHAQQLREVAHAHLRCQQHEQDTHARPVAEHLEQICQPQQRFLLRQLVLHFFHHFLVHTQETAALYLQLLFCLRHAFRLLA